jgi:hypothetical protein
MGQGSSSDAKTAIRQALRDVWIDDTKRDTCFNCRAAFSIANRRHHCRSCGELFCKKCWGALVALPEEVFPDLSDTCRTPQPVCEACRTVLQLPGRVGKALWSGGIVVRIGATIVKGNPLAAGSDSQSPANDSSPPSPPYPPGGDTPPPPARSTPVLSDDRYLITLERWRPFNRLTCLAVDRVLDEKTQRLASTLTAPVPPTFVARAAYGDPSAHLPESLPQSLSRGMGPLHHRPRGYAKANRSTESCRRLASTSSTSQPPQPTTPQPMTPPLVPAPAMLQPPRIHLNTVAFSDLDDSGPGGSNSVDTPATGTAAPHEAFAVGELPERWESLLHELISVSLTPGAAGEPSGVRCETKADVVEYCPINAADTAAFEAVLASIVHIARQRSIVRVSEPSTSTSAGGSKRSTAGKERATRSS